MSVLDVFGQNLRNLTALRGSQAQVAEELDINRIQFGRYLRSESFPKPNTLKRICDYFEVDARILTDLLTPAQLESIAAGGGRVASMASNPSIMNEAITYCAPDQGYFTDSHEIPDGIYQCWRRAKSQPDKAYRWLRRIHTVNGARVIRTFDRRIMFPKRNGPSNRAREIRGMLLRQKIGYAVLMFQGEPSRLITADFYEQINFGYTPAAVGFSALLSDTKTVAHRVSRSLMYRLDGGFGEILKAAREPYYVDWGDVPPMVYAQIRPRDEAF